MLGEAETLGRLEDFVRLGDPDANGTREQRKEMKGQNLKETCF